MAAQAATPLEGSFVPLHRKATHRPKILAAAMGVAVTVSGVAFAAQVGAEKVESGPGPLTASSAPALPTSSGPAVPEDQGERGLRPTRSASTERAPLPGKAAGRRGGRSPQEKASPTRSPSPSKTLEPKLGTTPRTTSPTKAGTRTPDATTRSSTSGAVILGATNAARRSAGVPALDVSSCLEALAQRHAERLANAGRLYHEDLGSVLRTCGLSTAGENVAMNYSGPSDMVDQWLRSPGHRANLLSRRFSLIGIGVAQARDGAWYGVQVFGAR
jgi:uncharacterized protein YkwD